MTFEPVATNPGCFVIEFGSARDLAFALGLVVIPAVAIPLIARTAKRYPSQAMLRGGPRRAGVLIFRAGLVVAACSLAGIVLVVVAGGSDPLPCTEAGGTLAVISVVLTVVGGLLIGGGWALSTHSTWVVLATIAVLDAWIFYFNIVASLEDPEAVRGLLLLAFAIHGICTTVAARWSFVAKDLGPIERAKAGEAGRTLSAVWAFLAAYSALTLVRADDGIFDTAAGSAVTGALSLGALAVTMGSGFTKYAEAISASRADSLVTAAPTAIESAPGAGGEPAAAAAGRPGTPLGTAGGEPDAPDREPPTAPPDESAGASD